MINEGTGSLNITLEGMVSQHSGDLRYSKFLCGVCFFLPRISLLLSHFISLRLRPWHHFSLADFAVKMIPSKLLLPILVCL